MLHISYLDYYDKILGGWIGKNVGGAVGARFEGLKGWNDITDIRDVFPDKIPPNDDLDLQVLWLKVLEEKGLALRSDDLADAWIQNCWYPFNEYGAFRRNYMLGLHPPYSGSCLNEFYDTGMGCPIRSEIWGYVFPGQPDMAAGFANKDGCLDHASESIGAEMMFSACAASMFFDTDVISCIKNYIRYVPEDSPMLCIIQAAFKAYDDRCSLRHARERLLLLNAHTEACDARLNVGFIMLALLYGEGDWFKTLSAAIECGYDTDCTAATSLAFIGQLTGAHGVPEWIKNKIGDELVMGIQYKRNEMTLNALARDTVRIGVLFSQQTRAIEISGAPSLTPLPDISYTPEWDVEYENYPSLTAGEVCVVTINGASETPVIHVPKGWSSELLESDSQNKKHRFLLESDPDSPVWQAENLFTIPESAGYSEKQFGIIGEAMWALLGVFYDPYPSYIQTTPQSLYDLFQLFKDNPHRCLVHNYVELEHDYLNPESVSIETEVRNMSTLLDKPAILQARNYRIALTDLLSISGQCCVYIGQEMLADEETDVYFVIGNNDAFHLYVNDTLILKTNEQIYWTPVNHCPLVHLKKGINKVICKLIRRGKELEFSLRLRQSKDWQGKTNSFVACDYVTNIRQVNPLTYLMSTK